MGFRLSHLIVRIFIFHSYLGPLPPVPGVSASTDPPNFVLSWSAYSVSGATVSYYLVCVRRDPTSADCDSVVQVDASETSYTLTGLTEPGVYYLSVSAVTTLGTSSPSGAVTLTVTGPPAAVSGFSASPVSSNQISYSWTSYQLSSGTVYNYVICLKLDVTQQGCNVLEEIPATATSYTVDSLNANTVYFASIYANTSFGLSVESNSVQTGTLEGG